MKKIYALFMTLCLVISATAAPLAGVAKKSYPLYQPEVVKAELALDAMQKAPAATQGLQYDAEAGGLTRYYNETDLMEITTDYVAESGALYIDLMAADQSDYTSLLLFVEDTVEFSIIPEGVYEITNTGATGTAYASQGYSQTQGVIPCAYYPLVMQNGQLYISTPMYFMVSGTVTVEYNEMGIPKITVDALNSNGVAIKVVFEIGGKTGKEVEKVPLQYDATEADGALDYTFAEGATATATDKGFYGTYMVDAADASCELGLLFVYPEGVADAETTIPAGTYTISDSQAAGTVLASSGYSSNGLGYSFFININAEGKITLPMYFLVEGTVEVTKVDGKLKVEVNGLNSNGVAVHVVYDATPAEEEEVTVPTNEELWEAFKPYYNEYYGLTRADQTIDKVSTFAAAKMQEIMTDEASEYKWLGDYVLAVAAGQGVTLPTDMEAANEGAWRWAVHAFFNAAVGQHGAAGTDFTEVGKPENWGPYYLAAQGGTTEPEYALEETVEISNLQTETLTVGDATYLQLTGRNDMLDSDVQLFLNNYTGEDKEYEVNVESSLMTFGGIELTVVEGTIAQTTDPEKGQVYTGRVIASAEEEGEVMLVALDLVMYATPAVEVEIIDAVARVDEATGALVLTAEWTDTVSMVTYPVFITVADYNEADLDEYGYVEYEGAQISELQIGDDDNWLDYAIANAVAILKEGNVVGLEAEYTSWNTGATYHVYAEGVMQGGETSEYDVYEDEITNLVIDYDNLFLIGGPSTNFQVEVVLGLGDYDRNTDTYTLLPESSISVMGSEATFIDGYASVDGIEQSATAVVHCTWNEMAIEFHLTMTATPLEPTVVVVENAVVEIEKFIIFGDNYDYALKMTGVWHNEEDGLDYPVLVEVPVYYPEATEPSEIYSTVTVGGWEDDDPWLGFGEGTLTVTTVDNVVTATGIVENPGAGIAIDITISGTIVTTGLENATVTVKPVKVLKNGQLIIEKDGVQYNAQGAQL